MVASVESRILLFSRFLLSLSLSLVLLRYSTARVGKRLRTLLERELFRNAINVAPLIRRVPLAFFFLSFFFLSLLSCFPYQDVSGQLDWTRRKTIFRISLIYSIFTSVCSDTNVWRSGSDWISGGNLDPSSIRRELAKAHHPLDLSNSERNSWQRSLRQVYRFTLLPVTS